MTRNGPQWSDIDEQAVDPALNYLFEERERWVESIYNPPTICAHRLLASSRQPVRWDSHTFSLARSDPQIL